MTHRHHNTAALVLALSACLGACSGGTAGVIEAELKRDRDRQARRAAQDVAASEKRTQTRRATLLVVAEALGQPVERVQDWTIHVTRADTMVGVRDPEAQVCVVLIRDGDGLAVYSMGRPPKVPEGVDLRAGPDGAAATHGRMVDADIDAAELRDWVAASCGPPAP